MGDIGTDCPFCFENIPGQNVVLENELVFAIKDGFPVTPEHMLILTKRHTPDLFSMTREEREQAYEMVADLKDMIAKKDQAVTGFNVGVNCGESAGQTIFHVHIHLIPRRDGDHPNPRGGVRGVIPEKQNYFMDSPEANIGALDY